MQARGAGKRGGRVPRGGGQAGLDGLDEQFRVRRNRLSPALLGKEFERLAIELAWKSSRLEGSTCTLPADDYCPLSCRSVNEIECTKAVVLFYGQNGGSNFKKLFLEQFRQAVTGHF